MGKVLIIKGANFSENSLLKHFVVNATGKWVINVFKASENNGLLMKFDGSNLSKGSAATNIITVYAYKTEYDANHSTEQTDRLSLYNVPYTAINNGIYNGEISVNVPTEYQWINVSVNIGTGTLIIDINNI